MSTYQIPNVNNKPPQLVDTDFYSDIRLDPDSSQPVYVGLHVTNGASTFSLDWKILKLTYNGSNIERVQVAYGSWDNRATYF